MKLFVNGKEWVIKDDYEGQGSPRVYQTRPGEKHMVRFWGPLRRAPKQVPVAVEFGDRCKGPTVSTVMTWRPWQRYQWFELPTAPRITDRQGLEWDFNYQSSGLVQWTTVSLSTSIGTQLLSGPFLGFRLGLREIRTGRVDVRLGPSIVGSLATEIPLLDAIDMAKELAISTMERRCREAYIVRPDNTSRFQLLK
jgi:hypothetical protein